MASFKIKVGLAGDLAASRMKVDMVCLPDERNGYRLATCYVLQAAPRCVPIYEYAVAQHQDTGHLGRCFGYER